MDEKTTPPNIESNSKSTNSSAEAPAISTTPNQPPKLVPFNYLKGWRAQTSRVALYLSIFLANFEVSIMSTSLIAITDDLKEFKKSNWIVTAYLVTYTVFILVWTKLADIFKQRIIQCFALLIFVVFSAACGAAQTTEQLIILRAFQGIGGAGLYAVPTIMCFELSPPEQRAKYMGVLAAVFALSYVLGPLIGGAIASNTTWRWVFLINVPAGIIAMILLLIALPSDFPYQGDHPSNPWKGKRLVSRQSLKRVDFIGILLLLTASVLLIFAVDEAGGVDYAWSSPLVIAFLAVSVVLWIVFFLWQFYISKKDHNPQQPVLPWPLLQSRPFIGMIGNSFTVGAVYTICVVQIPQRTQTLSNCSPLQAGYRLLPLVLASPLGSFVASLISKKRIIPSLYTMLIAAAVQIIGSSLISTLPPSTSSKAAQYGYEIILGFGLGVSISTLFLTVPENIERKYQAVALGSITQARSFGGAIGLAAVTGVMITSLTSNLSKQLSAIQLRDILQSAAAINELPASIQSSTRSEFGKTYNEQMRIVIGLAVAQFLVTMLLWKKKAATGSST